MSHGHSKGPREPFEKADLYIILSVCLVQFSQNVLFSMVTPFLPDYIFNLMDQEGGATDQEKENTKGLIFSFMPMGVLLTATFWGWLSGKVGRKPVLYIGLFFFCISTILFGQATAIWTLGLFRFIQGISSAACGTSSLALLSDTFPKRRNDVMGLSETASGIGYIIGPTLGAFLYSAGRSTSLQFAFQLPFLVAGAILGSQLVILPVLFRYQAKVKAEKEAEKDDAKYLVNDQDEEVDAKHEDDDKDDDDIIEKQQVIVSGGGINDSSKNQYEGLSRMEIIKMVVNKKVIICLFAVVIAEGLQGALEPIVSQYLEAEFRLDKIAVGLFLLVPAILYAVVSPFITYITDAIGSIATQCVGCMISGFGFIMMGPMPLINTRNPEWLHLGVLLLSGVCMGAGYAFQFIPILPYITNTVGHHGDAIVGAVVGSFTAFMSAGQTIGPLMGAFVVGLLKFRLATMAMGLATMGFIPVLVSLTRAEEKENPSLGYQEIPERGIDKEDKSHANYDTFGDV